MTNITVKKIDYRPASDCCYNEEGPMILINISTINSSSMVMMCPKCANDLSRRIDTILVEEYEHRNNEENNYSK